MQAPTIKYTESIIYFQGDKDIWEFTQRAFQLFDRDKSGYLNPQQLFNFFQSAAERGIMKPVERNQLIQLFYKIDKDKNGKVTKQEFFQYMKKAKQNPQQVPQQKVSPQIAPPIHPLIDKMNKYQEQLIDQKIKSKVQEIFRIFDKNKSGLLDYYELSNYLQSQFGNKYNYFQFIKIADQSKDKLINKQELYNFYRKQIKI